MSKYRIGAYVPDGHARHPRELKEKHRCGKCMNPHTGGRDDCRNNRKLDGHCSKSKCVEHCKTGCQCVVWCWKGRAE